jgi:arabinan endo-1,5-alpha-L-arabinosidase
MRNFLAKVGILVMALLLVSGSGDLSALQAAQSTPEVTPTLLPGTFVNPVLDRDFPDPDVLKVGDTYYAFATNAEDINMRAARTTDLVHWEMLPSPLPKLPEWAVQKFGWIWAPELTTTADGKSYVMYFVARFAIGDGGTQCIGVATGDSPEKPFTLQGDKPLICQIGEGGSIDPASYVDDDGTRYVMWKNDGNSGGGQTWIYIQKVSDDGLTLVGEPSRLITADQGWEGVLVEAPTMWKRNGKYYLFYSANAYNADRYAVGYAVSDKLLGPYKKPARALLATNIRAGIVGPGGQDIVLDKQGNTWILFHGWAPGGYRRLYLARLDWENDAPVVKGLTHDPQPAPVMTASP